MNKEQFLQDLTIRLSGLSENNLRLVLDFYSELISDRMEDGLSETEAVAALGDPAKIAEEVLSDLPVSPSEAPICEQKALAEHNSRYSEKILSIEIEAVDMSVVVRPGTLSGPETAQVEFDNVDVPDSVSCTLSDGVLRIKRRKIEKNFRGILHAMMDGFKTMFADSVTCTVILSDPEIANLSFRSASGDLSVSGLVLSHGISASAASGDLSFSGMHVQDSCSLHTASGDIELTDSHIFGNCELLSASGDQDLKNTHVDGNLNINAASGDIDLVDVATGSYLCVNTASGDQDLSRFSVGEQLKLNAASGDITIHGAKGGSLTLNTASGDIEVHSAQLAGPAAVTSASGDVRLRDFSGDKINLYSHSGDISARLTNIPGGYDFRVRSRSGDIRYPNDRGQHLVEARTISGDINISVE